GDETLVATLGTGTTYADTGLTNGSTYYYKVTARNSRGESSLSTELSATPTAAATAPAAPALASAVAGDGIVGLSWSAPADGGSPLTGYTLYRSPPRRAGTPGGRRGPA